MQQFSTPTQKNQQPPSLFRLLFGFMILISLGGFLQAIPVYGVLYHIFYPVFEKMMGDIASGNISTDQATELFYGLAEKILEHPLFTIASLVGTMAIVGLFLFWNCSVQKRSVTFLGIKKEKALPHYLSGMMVGFLMFCAAIGICVLSGACSIASAKTINPGYIGLFFFGFLIQGFEEELLLRGYLLNGMRSYGSKFSAVIISSIVFAFLHTSNQGVTYLAIVNLILFGIFTGIYFLRTNSIWGVAAIHTVWNFMQGNFWGCTVSGMPIYDSIFVTTLTGGRELTHGGSFGPEGGLAVTIVLVTGIFLLLWTVLPSGKKNK